MPYELPTNTTADKAQRNAHTASWLGARLTDVYGQPLPVPAPAEPQDKLLEQEISTIRHLLANGVPAVVINGLAEEQRQVIFSRLTSEELKRVKLL